MLTAERVIEFFSGSAVTPLEVVVDPERSHESYALMRSQHDADAVIGHPPNQRRIEGRYVNLSLVTAAEYLDVCGAAAHMGAPTPVALPAHTTRINDTAP